MKLLVLDGNSILNRAFYGIKLLTTKSGFYTNAIFGFISMLNKLIDEVKPDAVAIAFDVKTQTFRHKKFKEYKAQRKGMPQELFMQLDVLKELLTYLGYKLLECEGFEADDILGTLAKACEESGDACIIATGDRDSLQLVSPFVTVRITTTKFGRPDVTIFNEDKVLEVYGVVPHQLIDIKAIEGDTSDNIPGVFGIGQKGAAELIKKYGSVDYIYEHIDELDIKENMRKKLIIGKEDAYLSRCLGTIVTNVPVDKNINSYIPSQRDEQNAVRLLIKLEMFSMIEKMGLVNDTASPYNDGARSSNSTGELIGVITDGNLREIAKMIRISKSAVFAYSMKNDEINSLAFKVDNTIYVADKKQDKFSVFLKDVFENDTIAKISYDLKAFAATLDKMDIVARGLSFDIMLAAYLLNPTSKNYELDHITTEYGVCAPLIKTAIGHYSPLARDAAVFKVLFDILSAKLSQNKQQNLLREIESPFSGVLACMENAGFEVDDVGIKDYAAKIERRTTKIESLIYEHVGKEFNINSPKQMGEALFENLGLPHGKKTKSGYSTSADILEKLRHTHPVIDLVLQYRALSKIKSTYCDGLVKEIASDGRVHSRFDQTQTRTGRISSLEPNLQNIPVRTQLGREMRKFFRAKDGYLLIDADYSQIELRLLAHLSNDKNMIADFNKDLDIHAITASQVFSMPLDAVTPLMRNRAKAVNFGIVYGIGAFSLSKDIGVTVKEADDYIKSYLSYYYGVADYMDKVVGDAKENGFVETMLGRRRYLPELASSNFNLRAFGERVARNMPIQGAAADIIKIAMIKIHNRLLELDYDAKIILQIHDELIVEAREDIADTVALLLKEELENAIALKVPLLVDVKIGKTWYDAKCAM